MVRIISFAFGYTSAVLHSQNGTHLTAYVEMLVSERLFVTEARAILIFQYPALASKVPEIFASTNLSYIPALWDRINIARAYFIKTPII